MVRAILLSLLGMMLIDSVVHAQNSRLFERGPLPPRLNMGPTLDNASWISVPVPPPKEIRVNDIVTIRVDMTTRTTQDGQLQRRKSSNFDALLSDWVLLEGLSQLKPAPQSDGDQRVRGQLNNQVRATADLKTTETLKFEIGATIASILPNGNLVLEAHRKVKSNEDVWLHSLSGVCPKEAVGPGNVILSKDIASLEITKQELGNVRESYQRGWLQRLWDRYKAF